jgi:hypothetical protein
MKNYTSTPQHAFISWCLINYVKRQLYLIYLKTKIKIQNTTVLPTVLYWFEIFLIQKDVYVYSFRGSGGEEKIWT